MHDTPANVVLNCNRQGELQKAEFHYCSVIEQLNYLAATTRPDIQFSVHQCAQFCDNPKLTHKRAVKCIIWYLQQTPHKGLIMHVRWEIGIQCFVDADFAGSYKKQNPINPRDCLSCTGYVVKFANCPIIWISKLQTTIALSTTEVEYMAFSAAARKVIFLLYLVNKLKEKGINGLSS
jgi:hypothetical protein